MAAAATSAWAALGLVGRSFLASLTVVAPTAANRTAVTLTAAA